MTVTLKEEFMTEPHPKLINIAIVCFHIKEQCYQFYETPKIHQSLINVTDYHENVITKMKMKNKG